jgi:hypothetical protein
MNELVNQSLKDKLSLQLIILTIIEERFSILKFLYEEYEKDNKGTFNNFIIKTMHVYRTCIIIDLCKLYIVPNDRSNDKYKGKSQQNNFYHTIHMYKEDLKDVFDSIESLLMSLEKEVKLITNERDKELAHKDISTGISVRMYLDYMVEIELLIFEARNIIEKLFRFKKVGIDRNENKNITLRKVIDFLKKEKESYEKDIFSWIENRNKI